MAIPNRQIGWSYKANLLYEISKRLDRLISIGGKVSLGSRLNYNGYSYVKRVGDVLYIQTKYNDTKDLVIVFQKCMENELMTFSEVGLVDNATKTPLSNFEITTSVIVSSSDNIGPIALKDRSFVGGSHLLGALKTAKTNSFKFYVDDVEFTAQNVVVKSNNVKVTVENELYDTLTLTPDVREVIINESVIYNVVKNNIEVNLSHTYVKSAIVQYYYGMQMTTPATKWENSVYIAHSDDLTLQGITADLDSGGILSYPNVEKSITCKSDKSICVAMWMNTTKGAALGRESRFFSGTYPAIFYNYSSKKYYHDLIRGVNTEIIAVGHSYFWNGIYTIFDNSSIPTTDTDVLFAYKMVKGGKDYLVFDVNGTIDETITIPELKGKKISVESNDSTLTITSESDGTIRLQSSGYGNAYVKIVENTSPTALTSEFIIDTILAKIDFTDNSGGTAQHEVYSSTNGNTSVLLTTLEPGIVTYNDTLCKQNASVVYSVRSKSGSVYSDYIYSKAIVTPLCLKTDQSTLTQVKFNTLNCGAGSVTIHWGLGADTVITGDNTNITKDYGAGNEGQYNIWLTGNLNHITTLDLNNQVKVKGNISNWILPAKIATFNLYSNSVIGILPVLSDYNTDTVNRLLSYKVRANLISQVGDIIKFSKEMGTFDIYNMSVTLPSAEIDKILLSLANYFQNNVPVRNCSFELHGAGNGIPTGGANNTDRLRLIAYFTAASKVATVNVRTV